MEAGAVTRPMGPPGRLITEFQRLPSRGSDDQKLLVADTMEAILAYFDPGVGSLILQAILGGVGGIAVLGRHFWRSRRHRHAENQESLLSRKG